MSRLFVSRNEIAAASTGEPWKSVMFAEFEAQMSSEARPFPCIFGVAGHRLDQLRYLFLDPFDIGVLGEQLARFVAECRAFGPNTSLVVFTRPRPVQTLSAYYRKLWLTLDELARSDTAAWPAHIPPRLDDPFWEFSFAGEPIFVVCNTPAHVMRQSRRASAFMLTFQPRWVFDVVLANEKAARSAFTKVRKRLATYDGAAPSPLLGAYGDAGNREYKQYFLMDDDHTLASCPFSHLARNTSPETRDAEEAA